MRYWKLKEGDKAIATNDEVQMTPRWKEITKEEFQEIRLKETENVTEN